MSGGTDQSISERGTFRMRKKLLLSTAALLAGVAMASAQSMPGDGHSQTGATGAEHQQSTQGHSGQAQSTHHQANRAKLAAPSPECQKTGTRPSVTCRANPVAPSQEHRQTGTRPSVTCRANPVSRLPATGTSASRQLPARASAI